MIKIKFLEWLKYTMATIKSRNRMLPMASNLDKSALECLKEIEKTDVCKSILLMPDLAQFFFSPYATALNYHQAILSASLSKYSLSSYALVRPQLESALIFLYFINSSSEAELLERVESYSDWVVVKMYQNANRSSKFEFVPHLSTHESFMRQIEENYKVISEKYAGREKEFKELKRSSFLLNKRAVACENDIEGLYLHVQSEASASIHAADVSDRVSYNISKNRISYSLDNTTHDSFWILMLANLIQFHLIKTTATYFGVYALLKKQLEHVGET